MYDDVGEFENATFVAAGDMLIAQEGTTLGAPMNVSNFILVNSNAEPDLVVIDDEYLDGDDTLKYSLHLKPWGVRWEGEESKDYYEAAIKDYIAMLDSNEAPKYGWVNPVYGEEASQAVAKADSSDAGSDDIDSSVSDTDANEAASSTQSATDPNAVDPDNYVIVDNDMFKITVTGVGAYEYNADWIGYTLIIESKTDYTLGFGSTAEEYALDADIYSIKNNTCYYNGEVTETHFKTMVKAGATDDKTVLAIDGITDVSQVKNVKGYIKVWNNETGGSDIIGYYPYSFK